MSINIYNSEGYLDTTAFQALKEVEKVEVKVTDKIKDKKMVFICSPYAGDIERNTTRAKRFGRYAAMKGYVPFVPHLLYPQFLDEHDPDEREIGISLGLEVLNKCDELWFFGHKISKGMAIEIKLAKKLKIPIRHFDIHCQENLVK